MKKRRIDFHKIEYPEHSSIVYVLEESKNHFLVEWDCGDINISKERKCFNDGTTEFKHLRSNTWFTSGTITWKPHEYRQEARQSCLFAYWFLKRIIGKDPAGIIAKFVWSTRFDEIWETQ